jgi:hypothetical protein
MWGKPELHHSDIGRTHWEESTPHSCRHPEPTAKDLCPDRKPHRSARSFVELVLSFIEGLRMTTLPRPWSECRQRRSHSSEGSTYSRVPLALFTPCGLLLLGLLLHRLNIGSW